MQIFHPGILLQWMPLDRKLPIFRHYFGVKEVDRSHPNSQ